jgi:hypothetical protein
MDVRAGALHHGRLYARCSRLHDAPRHRLPKERPHMDVRAGALHHGRLYARYVCLWQCDAKGIASRSDAQQEPCASGRAPTSPRSKALRGSRRSYTFTARLASIRTLSSSADSPLLRVTERCDFRPIASMKVGSVARISAADRPE